MGTSMRRWIFSVAVLVPLALPLPAAAWQQTPALPEEVRTWIERDQLQRWAALIAEGDSIFNNGSCTRCHGPAGTSGRNGPDLTDTAWVQGDGSLQAIWETIFWGVRRRDFADPAWRFEMNPAGGLDLEWEQYASLAAYVWSLGNGTHLPGR
jgi:mono/diheme cytochrome c family protein